MFESVYSKLFWVVAFISSLQSHALKCQHCEKVDNWLHLDNCTNETQAEKNGCEACVYLSHKSDTFRFCLPEIPYGSTLGWKTPDPSCENKWWDAAKGMFERELPLVKFMLKLDYNKVVSKGFSTKVCYCNEDNCNANDDCPCSSTTSQQTISSSSVMFTIISISTLY